MDNLKPQPMTLEKAIEILHPDTTLLALGEIEYFAGFNGHEAKLKACEEACIVACEAMQREVDRRDQPEPQPPASTDCIYADRPFTGRIPTCEAGYYDCSNSPACEGYKPQPPTDSREAEADYIREHFPAWR